MEFSLREPASKNTWAQSSTIWAIDRKRAQIGLKRSEPLLPALPLRPSFSQTRDCQQESSLGLLWRKFFEGFLLPEEDKEKDFHQVAAAQSAFSENVLGILRAIDAFIDATFLRQALGDDTTGVIESLDDPYG